MSRHHRHREMLHESTGMVSAGGRKADLLHLCGSIGLMAAVIGLRIRWRLHLG